MLKTIRTVIGIALMVFAFPILIDGGFTRASIQYGFPAHPRWAMIFIGLGALLCGMFLIRPPAFLHKD